MNLKPREAVWILLSELFVDTELAKEDLHAIGTSLQETGFSVDEIEAIGVELRIVGPADWPVANVRCAGTQD